MTRAIVNLWGRQIGAVLWDESRQLGVFEYTPEFIASNYEVAPLTMPLRSGVYDFPGLASETFKGLPGMLADSLPDRFGNAVINSWLAEQGRTPESFDPVERLCYTGRRGMGALEFEPSAGQHRDKGGKIDIAPLVDLANRVIAAREQLNGVLDGQDDQMALEEILRVGTSAGGARAKAVLAWNEATGEFHSGQLDAGAGYTYWLMKFDGVSGNADKEVADPLGFGRLEYACYLLAKAAGVDMARSRLHEEGGRAHFMTQRFDRTADGKKLHMQSLCAMRHFDFNLARAYSYEQAVETIRMLGLGRDAIRQQVRRALLNIFIRNQDDHTKNIAFLMDPDGRWSLSPAFDVVYAYNPDGAWTSQHQMSLSGKTDGIELDDLLTFGKFADMKTVETKAIIREIEIAISKWPEFCDRAGLAPDIAKRVTQGFRSF
ncbi:serine/threonine-protein kinase HipA [Erythromicrobium ramosum]|uniref:Serine/threonine-protein kinase HipA n=1 Tax=Erythrobacter ramosus TaxID=35811 RepID=A0A6I4UEM8_9SPHN|nr:type II toxin-antitoxin system HipA family toxin [Erythrobacter ramosus]MBB3775038.1 serine/threonine-protein kinase HipA [Erythrobacter ramosus]MXP37332.1 type II toxin-antitoxin system HipA family toxin [Erythrobacter ramosus]